MNHTPTPAIRKLQEACVALDETRYRISCAIVAENTDHETARALQQINLRLGNQLTLLQELILARAIRETQNPPTTT